MPEDEVERIAAEDPDNPPGDERHWAQARVGLPTARDSVQVGLDRDVVEFFRRAGPGYRTRMNAVLRSFMEAERAKKADG